jgi:pyruvate dehydrogenase E2 component (dihydrolipoamide acetyltransferase)
MSIVALTVPKWGLAMEEGTVTGWHKAEGDAVAAGDELVDVESSKIANVIEAPAAGVLRRITAQEGQTLPVGALLAVIADASVSDADIDGFVSGFVIEAVADDSGPAGPQFAEVNGLNLAYTDSGSGPAVVLVHGFGGNRDNWALVQMELASQARIICVDLPGHGASSKSGFDASLGGLAAALNGLLDHLGVDAPVLAGHSMGAAVSIAAAKARAAKAVVALCGAGLGSPVNGDYISAFLEAERRKEMTAAAEMLFADPDLVSRDMVEDLLKYKRTDGVPEALAAIAAGALKDADADLSVGLAAPLTILWGAADQVIAADPARGEIIPGAGHMPQVEAAGLVTSRIAATLG